MKSVVDAFEALKALPVSAVILDASGTHETKLVRWTDQVA